MASSEHTINVGYCCFRVTPIDDKKYLEHRVEQLKTTKQKVIALHNTVQGSKGNYTNNEPLLIFYW